MYGHTVNVLTTCTSSWTQLWQYRFSFGSHFYVEKNEKYDYIQW